jgi:hypothetical protein
VWLHRGLRGHIGDTALCIINACAQLIDQA